ncbi:hypothetical protein Pmani_027158 [Petrolisthes manimaculis]|uniref:Uncharacterized protein n=1 Tax=Petrolisthes manimaculis TaxID=1843537 RepID=A0AAE1TZD3_9EUCA|nr:hypothetical protein Pmani_027158 [Petrolisthes manimaculis]
MDRERGRELSERGGDGGDDDDDDDGDGDGDGGSGSGEGSHPQRQGSLVISLFNLCFEPEPWVTTADQPATQPSDVHSMNK